ncbi:MAG: hypothetical protein AUH72_02155 [Acidobacteria bacterium 13_1_40CM_4_65_8]|nr:MAG: hypothetical protein AUH72_02155 [Acidobacteria bacterium 13_1_40CM_4_65_8]
MKSPKTDLLQGTLDLLILRTLASGDMHGWGISQRLQQVSRDVLQVTQGSLYPALYRLEQRGWIESSWRDSEHNRRAKYYRLTKSGRKQLAEETATWERITTASLASFSMPSGGLPRHGTPTRLPRWGPRHGTPTRLPRWGPRVVAARESQSTACCDSSLNQFRRSARMAACPGSS